MNKTKHCPDCKRDKPIESFYHDKYSKDHLTQRCKTCHYIYQKNPSRVIVINRILPELPQIKAPPIENPNYAERIAIQILATRPNLGNMAIEFKVAGRLSIFYRALDKINQWNNPKPNAQNT